MIIVRVKINGGELTLSNFRCITFSVVNIKIRPPWRICCLVGELGVFYSFSQFYKIVKL